MSAHDNDPQCVQAWKRLLEAGLWPVDSEPMLVTVSAGGRLHDWYWFDSDTREWKPLNQNVIVNFTYA